ncbi:hypothetical protein LUX33_51550 [Actinomadura madurae]|nr:hypothetical protein [Actinomadura madurae]MCP9955947.1 hypothetical protein [Actinomadura madurae]
MLEVAVVAVPDDKWGERPKAFVVLRDGHAVTGTELVEHVRKSLARFKAPGRRGVRPRAAEDVHRQDPEVPAPRAGGRAATAASRAEKPGGTGPPVR